MTNYFIKIAKSTDELKIIAKCRIKAFPNSFSSKLGLRYVQKMLSYYITGNNFLIYLENNGECLGFVTGMVPDGDFLCSTREAIDMTYKDILKELVFKPWLLFHPVIISNFYLVGELIRNKISGAAGSESNHTLPLETPPEILNSVGLIDIAVAPDHQKNGYGSLLLKSFEEQCNLIGKKRMHLSVKPENIAAIKAYKKNNWKILAQTDKQITFFKNDT
ncbi:MAG: GNAT family N-acetyltransferase [Sediminibacterium sp.]|nr:GNAT family N-acetyltransferase [Sediminibacterium sp.]